jgi:hypothetical protein
MRRLTILMCLVALVALASGAYAELQNVEVGGSLRIRGRYWMNGAAGVPGSGPGTGAILGGGGINPNTPLSRFVSRALGPFGIGTRYDWDKDGDDLTFVEHRTTLHVKADFTEEVSAFIELDNYSRWGEDFRSQDYITGVDGRAAIEGSSAEVEV